MRVETKVSFSVASSFWAIHWAKYCPMAGAEDKPGDSMPTASKKPSALSPMIKSSASPSRWARRPQKLVMVSRMGRFGTLRSAIAVA